MSRFSKSSFLKALDLRSTRLDRDDASKGQVASEPSSVLPDPFAATFTSAERAVIEELRNLVEATSPSKTGVLEYLNERANALRTEWAFDFSKGTSQLKGKLGQRDPVFAYGQARLYLNISTWLETNSFC